MAPSCSILPLLELLSWGQFNSDENCLQDPAFFVHIPLVRYYFKTMAYAHMLVAVLGYLLVHFAAVRNSSEPSKTSFLYTWRMANLLLMTLLLAVSDIVYNRTEEAILLLEVLLCFIFYQCSQDIRQSVDEYSNHTIAGMDLDARHRQEQRESFGLTMVAGALLLSHRIWFSSNHLGTVLTLSSLSFIGAFFAWKTWRNISLSAAQVQQVQNNTMLSLQDIFKNIQRQRGIIFLLLLYVSFRTLFRLIWAAFLLLPILPNLHLPFAARIAFQSVYILIHLVLLPLTTTLYGRIFSFWKQTLTRPKKTIQIGISGGTLGTTARRVRVYSQTIDETGLQDISSAIHLAFLQARWWNDPDLSLQSFFSFPHPVNTAESRLHGLFVSFMLCIHMCLDAEKQLPFVILPGIVYGYFARVLCGPRLDPQAHLVLFVLRPIFVVKLDLFEDRFEPGPPKRFAQFAGFCVSALALVLRIFVSVEWSLAAVGFLVVLSSVQGVHDLCAGCLVFHFLMQVGIIPQDTCEACKAKFQFLPKRNKPAPKEAPRRDSLSNVSLVADEVLR